MERIFRWHLRCDALRYSRRRRRIFFALPTYMISSYSSLNRYTAGEVGRSVKSSPNFRSKSFMSKYMQSLPFPHDNLELSLGDRHSGGRANPHPASLSQSFYRFLSTLPMWDLLVYCSLPVAKNMKSASGASWAVARRLAREARV